MIRIVIPDINTHQLGVHYRQQSFDCTSDFTFLLCTYVKHALAIVHFHSNLTLSTHLVQNQNQDKFDVK